MHDARIAGGEELETDRKLKTQPSQPQRMRKNNMLMSIPIMATDANETIRQQETMIPTIKRKGKRTLTILSTLERTELSKRLKISGNQQ